MNSHSFQAWASLSDCFCSGCPFQKLPFCRSRLPAPSGVGFAGVFVRILFGTSRACGRGCLPHGSTVKHGACRAFAKKVLALASRVRSPWWARAFQRPSKELLCCLVAAGAGVLLPKEPPTTKGRKEEHAERNNFEAHAQDDCSESFCLGHRGPPLGFRSGCAGHPGAQLGVLRPAAQRKVPQAATRSSQFWGPSPSLTQA